MSGTSRTSFPGALPAAGVNTVTGNLVLSGIVEPAGSYDHDGMVGHGRSARCAAFMPHMKWTPPPGAVDEEHRYTPGTPVS